MNYFVGMFFITAGYHRYFSHRAFKLNRFWQFVFGWFAQTTVQKGILWWAANHRHHHQYSDQPEDSHSPLQNGFWYSHIGWILTNEHDEIKEEKIKDFSKYPELRWLQKWHWVPTVLFGVAMYFAGGLPYVFWGWILAVIVLNHGTYTINSLSHLWGSQRFNTGDTSRNNFLLALITLGEGWHNNHHYCMYAARQGIKWYEIDITYYILVALSRAGIVKDLRGFRIREEDLIETGKNPNPGGVAEAA